MSYILKFTNVMNNRNMHNKYTDSMTKHCSTRILFQMCIDNTQCTSTVKTQDIPSPSTNLREYTHPSSEREHLHGKPVQKGCYKVLNYPFDSWLFWYQSDPEGFHQKLVSRQEFYFPFSYIYLRVSLWEEWYNMEQMTWKPWQTPAVLSSYQAGIQGLEELRDFSAL